MTAKRKLDYHVLSWMQSLLPALLLALGFHFSIAQSMAILGERLDNLIAKVGEHQTQYNDIQIEILRQGLKQAGMEARVDILEVSVSGLESYNNIHRENK
jgi:hypothetical protein